jgi:predicted nuclease with TOPRIM domain
MENTTPQENERKYSSYQEPKKKVPMILIVAVIALSMVAILLAVKLYVDNKNNAESLQYMEGEKSKLEGELNGLIVEYDSLKTKADTLDSQLTAEQDRIKKLLSINASNATKINMYKSELETLRKVMKSYIIQIDSLNTKNQMLTSENIQVKQELGKVTNDYQELSVKSEELSTTVKIAQKLNAKNIVAEGQNRNSKPTEKIKKVEKLKVCCTLRENAVAKAGKKMVYLRIFRPDEVVLSAPDAGTFEYEGNSIVYSAKRELEYENTDIDLCIYWDKTEELIPGTYKVILYAEGYEIGLGSMALK